MSHLRLTTSEDLIAPVQAPSLPGIGATRFASFTPMNDQPALADRKATFVIGAGGLLLSTTLFFITPIGQFARPEFWPLLTLILAFGLSCVTMLGVRIAYRCYTLAAPLRPANTLFFQNIACGTVDAYAGALEGTSERDALRDMLDYNYTMAALGAAKYRLAGQALLCLRIAIPMWMLLLTVITVRSTW